AAHQPPRGLRREYGRCCRSRPRHGWHRRRCKLRPCLNKGRFAPPLIHLQSGEQMRREYTTRSGVTLILRPVPWLAFQRLEIEWEKKRPRVPVVQVEIGDGQFREEENPDSPEYQEALAQWENQKGTAVS